VTGVREPARRAISPAPQRARLSFLGDRTQLDVSLPLDVPIARLTPDLVSLVRSREDGTPDAPSTTDARHDLWMLSRIDGESPLAPDLTLRDAGVGDGELLRLTSQRALSAPTLYDDVVDAAARLNKARYASWDATAARRMSFAGAHLASAAWVYILVIDSSAPYRVPLIGLSVLAALALAGGAALAHRTYGQSDLGAALGWAVLPIAAAVGWVASSDPGGYRLAAGCMAVVVVAVALFYGIGTGRWGYLATGVFFALSGLAIVMHSAGIRIDVVGAGLAVVATLGCLTVPRLTARLGRRVLAPGTDERADATVPDPSPAESPANRQGGSAVPPAPQNWWAGVQSANMTRSGVLAGLAVSAATGAVVTLKSADHVRWPELIFALVCAATLGLYAQRSATPGQRAATAIPAVALMVVTCVWAQDGDSAIPLAVCGSLVAATVVCAVTGTAAGTSWLWVKLRAPLAYSTYLGTAALIPLALWVVGAYQRAGLS
jgi:type VII secretion integral membrane protein EccD